MDTVPFDALGDRRLLRRGAEGAVHLLTGPSIPSLAGMDLVFKEYRRDDVALAAIERTVRARKRLTSSALEALDKRSVWPLVAVEGSAGQAVGVLMRLIPEKFFARVKLRRGTERIDRSVQHLFASADANERAGLRHASATERLLLCREVALVLGILHKNYIVYGDLSSTNILYALQPRPACLLLDCDGVRVKGTAAVQAQLHSPDWDPPEGPGVQTQESDRYKMALLFMRSLFPGRGVSVNRDPTTVRKGLDRQGYVLFRAALDGDATARPTAKEWFRYFSKLIDGAASAPTPHGSPPPGGKPSAGWVRDASGSWRRPQL